MLRKYRDIIKNNSNATLVALLFLSFFLIPNSGLRSQQKSEQVKQQVSQEKPATASQVEKTAPPPQYNKPLNDGPYIYPNGRDILVKYVHMNSVKSFNLRANKKNYKVKIPVFHQTYTIPTAPPTPESNDYRKVKKLFIISDIHGQFEWFKKLLINHKIVNKKMKWKFGKGHLVIVGDIFDRGDLVTEALWTVHQLAQQARKKGGRVHYLLGNHEVFNLQNFYRDSHIKYKYALRGLLGPEFNDLYSEKTVLGKWLRTRNTMIRINGMLFVHAGIHPDLLTLNLDIQGINQTIRDNLNRPRSELKADPLLDFLFYSKGPLWYRGFFYARNDIPKLTADELQNILEYFKVSRIIVGHTTQKHITPLFDNRIIGIDSGIKYGTKGEALMWYKGTFYRATADGERIAIGK
jgi:hypothetical protein